MASTGQTAANFTCHVCGGKGHTARSKDCPARAGATATAAAPKKERVAKKPAPKSVEDTARPAGTATAVARKLHWAIRGACDGHLSLDQLNDLAAGDDVQAVVGR